MPPLLLPFSADLWERILSFANPKDLGTVASCDRASRGLCRRTFESMPLVDIAAHVDYIRSRYLRPILRHLDDILPPLRRPSSPLLATAATATTATAAIATAAASSSLLSRYWRAGQCIEDEHFFYTDQVGFYAAAPGGGGLGLALLQNYGDLQCDAKELPRILTYSKSQRSRGVIACLDARSREVVLVPFSSSSTKEEAAPATRTATSWCWPSSPSSPWRPPLQHCVGGCDETRGSPKPGAVVGTSAVDIRRFNVWLSRLLEMPHVVYYLAEVERLLGGL